MKGLYQPQAQINVCLRGKFNYKLFVAVIKLQGEGVVLMNNFSQVLSGFRKTRIIAVDNLADCHSCQQRVWVGCYVNLKFEEHTPLEALKHLDTKLSK